MSLKVLKSFLFIHKDNKIFISLMNILLALIYFLISNASLKFATINSSVTPIWPSTGLAIFFLLIFGKRYTYSILIGAIATNLLTPSSPFSAIMIGLGNTAEAFLGCLIYEKINHFKHKLEHLTELFSIAAASFVAPVISATVGVFSLFLFNLIPENIIFNVWLTWWIADVVGALLLLPLLLSIFNGDFNNLFLEFKSRLQKYILVFISTVICLIFTYYVFTQNIGLKYLFLLLPVLLVFNLIKNKFYVYLCSFLLCAEAIIVTIAGDGIFNQSNLNQNLINLEIFITAICLTTMGLTSFNSSKTLKKVRFLLLIGWTFWGVIFFYIQKNIEHTDDLKVKSAMDEVEYKINQKIDDYINVLNSGRGLFLSSLEVDSNEWHNFVEALNISKFYEGINGMGVVYKVLEKDLLKHSKKYSNEKLKFQIKNLQNEDGEKSLNSKTHYLITFIEPIEKNKAALGLDLSTELNRKTAADLAMVSGKTIITDRVKLVQDKMNRTGFLMYMPVYKKNYPLTSDTERLAAFSHWIYAPFVTELVFKSVFTNISNSNLVFQIYDHSEMNEGQLLFTHNLDQINPKAQSIIKNIKLGEKTFYIKWSKGLNFASSNDFLSTWIGFIGAMSVLIIVLFIMNVLELEANSKIIAAELHKNFLDSQLLIKDQEAQIFESRKMATLGEMASSIAHEINNPLAIITGVSFQLKRHLEEVMMLGKEDKAVVYLTRIEKTAARIDKIVKGLRLFSRDASFDEMREVSIENLFEDTLSLCRERFRIANIQLSIEMNYRENLFCRDTQISQVLINLLNNSFDAIENLNDKWVNITINKNEKIIEILITDSGAGIPKEIQQKILMPFFSTKEVGKGTGLGLSISQGIIESHGGTLHVDFKHPNTCVVIQLPNTNLEFRRKMIT